MKITVLNGIYQGKEFDFTTSLVTIGRDGGNQLILDTDGVSRCHAELKQLPDGCWEIRDCDSTNGVKVEGSRIDGPVKISEGAKIQIGENMLLVSNLSQTPPQVIFNPIISMPSVSESAGAEMKAILPAMAESGAPEAGAAQSEGDEKTFSKQPDNQGAWDINKLSGSLFGSKGQSYPKEKKGGRSC